MNGRSLRASQLDGALGYAQPLGGALHASFFEFHRGVQGSLLRFARDLLQADAESESLAYRAEK